MRTRTWTASPVAANNPPIKKVDLQITVPGSSAAEGKFVMILNPGSTEGLVEICFKNQRELEGFMRLVRDFLEDLPEESEVDDPMPEFKAES